jgi:hypothetical protein
VGEGERETRREGKRGKREREREMESGEGCEKEIGRERSHRDREIYLVLT